MASSAYESLVGWRYLLRADRRPIPLIVGASLLAVGLLLVAGAVYLQTGAGGQVSIFGNAAGGAQTLLAIGGGVSVIGGCTALFGFLYCFMTVFSAFSTFMITIGVAEVILVLGVMNGFQGDLRSKIVNTNAHVSIGPGSQQEWLTDYRQIVKSVRQLDSVIGVSPILRTEVMLKSPTSIKPIAVLGIETDNIGDTTLLPSQLLSGCLDVLNDAHHRCGHWLLNEAEALRPSAVPAIPAVNTEDKQRKESPGQDEDDMAFPAPSTRSKIPPALLLGAELYRGIGAWPGEVVNIISPTGDLGPDGPIPRTRPFHIAGHYESGYLEFDARQAYAGLKAMQVFAGVGDVASGVQIKVNSLEDARHVRDQIRTMYPELRVTDWQDNNRGLFSALKLEKIAMFLVLTINILLAAFSIASTLVMTILERKREIAILMAMGSTTPSIIRIFLSQGAFTGVVGSLLGTSIGLGLGFALVTLGLPLNTEVYYIDAIPVDIRVLDVLAIIGVAMLVSLLSTIYPARIAARLKPVEGLTAE